MQILCVDVGTGTQDILLYDSEKEIENCIQLILPSPTRIVAERVRRASTAGRPIVLTGQTMGGGPCAWAVEDHLRHGFVVYATPDAARTFDDELEKVERLGVRLISEEEAARLTDAAHVVLGDLNLTAIQRALEPFDVSLDLAALAVAAFDHGNAPPGISDRIFRFEYLAQTVVQNDLAAFAYRREDVPPRLTRLRAVAVQAPADVPTLVMDTAPAAILGALDDPVVGRAESTLVVNLGNFHTLAFLLEGSEILGLFEHHSGELSRERLEYYLDRLARGSISNAEVFDDQGHGALVTRSPRRPPDLWAILGPRRALLEGSRLPWYRAVPHGDMMLAGCFGLLRAVARRYPELAGAIDLRLGPARW